MPLASIAIPIWNGAEYIRECIASVKSQTLSDFECIVVDDGSTDGSLALAMEAAGGDERFRFLRQEHQGLSAARNVGVAKASSDIMFHLDADDIALPGMMEEALRFLEDNSLEMAFFDSSVLDEGASKIFLESDKRYFKRKKDYGIGRGRDILTDMFKNGDYVYAAFLQAVRKSRIRRPFCPGLRAQDKLYTTQNLLLMERVGHLPKILHVKRCHPKCITYSRHDVHYAWSRLKTGTELLKMMEKEGIVHEEAFRIAVFELASAARTMECLDGKEFEWIDSLPLMDRGLMKAFERISVPRKIKMA